MFISNIQVHLSTNCIFMTTILKVYVHKYIPNTHRSIYHMVVCTLKFVWYNILIVT
jgi:hypothetical protein